MLGVTAETVSVSKRVRLDWADGDGPEVPKTRYNPKIIRLVRLVITYLWYPNEWVASYIEYTGSPLKLDGTPAAFSWSNGEPIDPGLGRMHGPADWMVPFIEQHRPVESVHISFPA